MSTEREFDLSNSAAEYFNSNSRDSYIPRVGERRQASRFERDEDMDFVIIWREPGEEHLVQVHDESLTGLGILVKDTLGLQVGSVVHVIYAGENLEGEVRHITKRPDDKYLIGLKTRRIVTE
jgi:hypothetical protein